MSATTKALIAQAKVLFAQLDELELPVRVRVLNRLKRLMHEHSPFQSEPVDCVLWVPADDVVANDYNPNTVAPPEMKLLEHSIVEDGYTQPIVSWKNDTKHEVVDGFHRNRVGKESKVVRKRVHGYLPVTTINSDRLDRSDRMASTIRHNRARGKHRVEAMSDIVIELKRRNWTDARISKNLGMEPDEVLRLCQISGLAELFQDQEFSQSWDIGDDDGSLDVLEDSEEGEPAPAKNGKNGSTRVYHTWEKWECYPAGFYETKDRKHRSKEECEQVYAAFLRDDKQFRKALRRVITEWAKSCQHYLSNENMNRIAWLGQASLCIAEGIPSTYRGGFNLLSPEEQEKANETALIYLNKWLVKQGHPALTMEQAQQKTVAELY